MKIFFLILISLSLNASDFLTNYRNNGISEIEKQMDLELTKNKYWSKYIKNKDTKFGYLESYTNVLTCNKTNSTLNLYRLNNKKQFKFQKEYAAFTGKLKGDKLREGDLKTPIGVYKLTKKLSNVDSFYGPMAFVTSYPNIYDKYRDKGGHGIWIHGLPSKQERDEFTKGCIAINNTNIKCLDRNIDIFKTVLIIDSEKVEQDVSKEILSSILSQLYKWRYSWKYNDINSYLSFYDSKFVRSDGMNYERFKNYKTRVFKKIEKRSIIFTNINLLPYPDTTDIYQLTFKEFYKSDTFEFIGDKVLVIRLQINNKIKILTEK
ncbi:MAG: hypothetical protein COB17_07355 [Sulfurimonas sp.]|nr:MAG: hypothetical protein COB17_07355 [Sulfurimonas sp.]